MTDCVSLKIEEFQKLFVEISEDKKLDKNKCQKFKEKYDEIVYHIYDKELYLWLKKEADNNNSFAQYCVGRWWYQWVYHHGQNYRDVLNIMKKSAKQGNILACDFLGDIYANGAECVIDSNKENIIEEDEGEAIKWYMLSSYYSGDKDYQKAKEILRESGEKILEFIMVNSVKKDELEIENEKLKNKIKELEEDNNN